MGSCPAFGDPEAEEAGKGDEDDAQCQSRLLHGLLNAWEMGRQLWPNHQPVECDELDKAVERDKNARSPAE